MPITIDGTGSITGLNAGGLPDLSVATADLADAAVTAPKLSGAQSGSAPIYAARAWVNFNGTGTVAIRASGNVSSITDNGTGDYTVNFTAALADTNYSVVATGIRISGGSNAIVGVLSSTSGYDGAPSTMSTTAVRISCGGAANTDHGTVCVAVFR